MENSAHEPEQLTEGTGFKPPDMIFARPAPIRIYTVTEEELIAIKNAASDVSQDFGFMALCLGIFFTSLATLLTTNQQNAVFYVFALVALVTFFVSIYCGIRWYRYRKRLPDLVDGILKSKETSQTADFEVAPKSEPKPSTAEATVTANA